MNTDVCLQVVRRIRKEFGTTKDIWSWTGYTFDELLQDSEDKLELLSQIDILVDGRFELSKRDLKLQFRGSSNQRIIDVQKSLESNQVVIWENVRMQQKPMNKSKARLDIKQLWERKRISGFNSQSCFIFLDFPIMEGRCFHKSSGPDSSK